MLAGSPADAYQADLRLCELALAVNRLSLAVTAASEAEVAALLPAIRKLTRSLQAEHAERHRVVEELL